MINGCHSDTTNIWGDRKERGREREHNTSWLKWSSLSQSTATSPTPPRHPTQKRINSGTSLELFCIIILRMTTKKRAFSVKRVHGGWKSRMFNSISLCVRKYKVYEIPKSHLCLVEASKWVLWYQKLKFICHINTVKDIRIRFSHT